MPLTVYKLLTELSKLPPDAPVYFPEILDDDGDVVQYEVTGVEMTEDGSVVMLD
jgi:hypothetical protein